MKKVVLASLLAVAGAVPFASLAYAQQPAAGGIQMSQDEYAAYNKANSETTAAAQSCGLRSLSEGVSEFCGESGCSESDSVRRQPDG